MYALTDPGCALRRWIVDEFVWEHDADSEDPLDFEEFKELNPEFLLDVVREQGRRLGGAVGEREVSLAFERSQYKMPDTDRGPASSQARR